MRRRLPYTPLKRALLQDMFVDQFMFYVPHRLVWADWESFIADGPMDTPNHIPPTVEVGANAINRQGLFLNSHPTDVTTYSAWSTYSLNLIWNEYFRDIDAAANNPGDSQGDTGLSVNAKKDYWTNLQNDFGKGQETFSIDTSGAQVPAEEILRIIAQQKIAMKRATYGTRYIDIPFG